jgi:beta-glucanase (GH16 family)
VLIVVLAIGLLAGGRARSYLRAVVGGGSAPPSAGAPGAAGGAGAPGAPGRGQPPSQPAGQEDGWDLAFNDEFDGTSLDRSRWDDHSTAEADSGHGNPGNEQLEWNRAENCVVGGGELRMTARRGSFTSPGGESYDWTSCLITSTPSYAFRYGFIEERAILPSPKGFWPAFWTWQAARQRGHIETDVYEFYSDNHGRLYATQFSGERGDCEWKIPFDPSADWHTYAANIAPDGTTWYVDGKEICHTGATSAGQTNLISNLAVYEKIPPAAKTTEATKRVDYIRAWTPSP